MIYIKHFTIFLFDKISFLKQGNMVNEKRNSHICKP